VVLGLLAAFVAYFRAPRTGEDRASRRRVALQSA
jgi:hypothetical protein